MKMIWTLVFLLSSTTFAEDLQPLASGSWRGFYQSYVRRDSIPAQNDKNYRFYVPYLRFQQAMLQTADAEATAHQLFSELLEKPYQGSDNFPAYVAKKMNIPSIELKGFSTFDKGWFWLKVYNEYFADGKNGKDLPKAKKSEQALVIYPGADELAFRTNILGDQANKVTVPVDLGNFEQTFQLTMTPEAKAEVNRYTQSVQETKELNAFIGKPIKETQGVQVRHIIQNGSPVLEVQLLVHRKYDIIHVEKIPAGPEGDAQRALAVRQIDLIVQTIKERGLADADSPYKKTVDSLVAIGEDLKAKREIKGFEMQIPVELKPARDETETYILPLVATNDSQSLAEITASGNLLVAKPDGNNIAMNINFNNSKVTFSTASSSLAPRSNFVIVTADGRHIQTDSLDQISDSELSGAKIFVKGFEGAKAKIEAANRGKKISQANPENAILEILDVPANCQAI